MNGKKRCRGVPPRPNFDFDALSDDALLTTEEAAAVLRLSVQTLEAWRMRDPNHPLKWINAIPGRPRYRVGDVRAFLAGAT